MLLPIGLSKVSKYHKNCKWYLNWYLLNDILSLLTDKKFYVIYGKHTCIKNCYMLKCNMSSES